VPNALAYRTKASKKRKGFRALEAGLTDDIVFKSGFMVCWRRSVHGAIKAVIAYCKNLFGL